MPATRTIPGTILIFTNAMNQPDPRCVLVLEDRRTAALIADWLTGRGLPAEATVLGIRNPAHLLREGQSPPAVEVRVIELRHGKAARELLAQNAAGLAALQQQQAEELLTVIVTCEECTKTSTWTGEDLGTTQDCPHCLAYMDVPHPDERWHDEDFGTPEDE